MHLGEGCGATNVLWREVYAPFGEELTDPAANDNDQGFTGHIKDDALGLTYMQARFYDPVIGRFLSNDPVGFSPARPDMFGRYAYAANDPVNKKDSLGLAPEWSYASLRMSMSHEDAIGVKAATADASKGLAVGMATGASAFTPGPEDAVIAAAVSTKIGARFATQLRRLQGNKTDRITTETRVRETPGADGSTSEMAIERLDGEVISTRHTVTDPSGKVKHQHQEHVGSSGSIRRFSDELTGTETVGDTPKVDKDPQFPAQSS